MKRLAPVWKTTGLNDEWNNERSVRRMVSKGVQSPANLLLSKADFIKSRAQAWDKCVTRCDRFL